MALPPAHLFVGAAAAECFRGKRIPAWKAWALGAAVAVMPDLDVPLLLFTEISGIAHGVYTHSLLATATITAIASGCFGTRWGLIVGTAWASHLLVDLLREGAKTSVYLLWPFSNEAQAPIAPLFPKVPFEWQEAPGWIPQVQATQPLYLLAQQTLVGLVVFLGVCLISLLIRWRTSVAWKRLDVANDKSGSAPS